MFCKNCGKEIPEDSKFCSFCGYKLEMESSQSNPEEQSQPEFSENTEQAKSADVKVMIAHRGTMILVFGILGISGVLCCCVGIFSLIAMIMGISDLKKMKMGIMDPNGKQITKIGMILGIVGLAMTIIVLAAVIIYSIVNGEFVREFRQQQFRGLMP